MPDQRAGHPSTRKAKKVTFTIYGEDCDTFDAVALLAGGRPGELAATWARHRLRALAKEPEVAAAVAALMARRERDKRDLEAISARRGTFRVIKGGS